MSAVDYAAKAATALRLLTRFGQTVTRNTRASGSYDPSMSTSTITETSTTRTGALLSYGKGIEYVRGMQVMQRDKRLLLDASGAADISDTYTVSGVEYAVQSLEDINPAGTVVMYDLHVRAV